MHGTSKIELLTVIFTLMAGMYSMAKSDEIALEIFPSNARLRIAAALKQGIVLDVFSVKGSSIGFNGLVWCLRDHSHEFGKIKAINLIININLLKCV